MRGTSDPGAFLGGMADAPLTSMRVGPFAGILLGFALGSSVAWADGAALEMSVVEDAYNHGQLPQRFRFLQAHEPGSQGGEEAKRLPPAVRGGAFFALRARGAPPTMSRPRTPRPPSWARPATWARPTLPNPARATFGAPRSVVRPVRYH